MEVTHTKEGMKMLENFLELCRVKREWNMEKFLACKMNEIKNALGDRKVFLLVGRRGFYRCLCAFIKNLGDRSCLRAFCRYRFLRKDEGKKKR